MSRIIVPGDGNPRARWAVVGEAPGADEGRQRRPFVGKTGREQDEHLARGGLRRRDGWFTNTVLEYLPDNPAPTPERTAEWRPAVEAELLKVRPDYVIAAGTHAARWFLGEDTVIEAVHGMPHRFKLQDWECTVIPVYHPAAHFYNRDLLAHILWDYDRATGIITGRRPVPVVEDLFPDPVYEDLDDCADYRHHFESGVVSFDTEGVPGEEWSYQVSTLEGTGLVVRKESVRYREFCRAFRAHLRKARPVVVIHNALYDIEMARGFGLDLLTVPLFDTMMAAYLLCLEPQSLKNLARRHCGMRMTDYMDTVGDIGKRKQLAYLERILEEEWPLPEPRVIHENDGTDRVYKPQPIARRAEAILLDVYSEKRDKEGNLADPRKRWRKVDAEQRQMVEARLGRMPVGTLADIDLGVAVRYSARDADATIRLYPKMQSMLAEAGLTALMDLKMRMLPAAAEIKMNGMIGDRASFVRLSEEMNERMDRYVRKIARKYNSGRPINPASGPQIEKLMRREGLEGVKKTPKGRVSTSKKSIEHLRFGNEAIELVQQWREHQKVRDSFADPVLENWPGDEPRVQIVGDLKISRVTSGRFSMTAYDDRPSAPLLAIPQRTEVGRTVRSCYVADEGYVLGSWDLDQAEMRMMADESGDEVLCKIFNDGVLDVHSDTASKIFGIPYKQLEEDKALRKKYRDPAKRAGFGVITGIQAQGLFDQMRMSGAEGWTLESVGDLIRDWFKTHPGVRPYLEWCKEECRRKGGVIRDRWEMPRHLPGVFSSDKFEKWEAERQTHSHRIQGGAQGHLQMVMAYLYPRLRKYGDLIRWRLQVHDELIIEVFDDEDLRREVDAMVINAMVTKGARLKVPIRSSGSYAHRWGDLK